MAPPTPQAPKPAAKPEPAAPPAAPPAPNPLEAEVAALTEKVAALEAGFASALEAEVAKYLGEGSPVAQKVDAAVEELTKLAQAKTTELGGEASTELEKAVGWAHARINALHIAVQRAIGVTITLPETPGAQASSDVTVTGTETADRLG